MLLLLAGVALRHLGDTMRLAKLNGGPEIFHTIQGEGSSIGKPAIFVRLSGCNLHCVWCDTPYTWNWEGSKFFHEGRTKFKRADEQVVLRPEEVAKAIMETSPCLRIVFTGGEPLAQQSEIVEVCKLLHALRPSERYYTFEVETNGTIAPHWETEWWINQFNVSPKLANSGNSERLRNKPKAMEIFSHIAHRRDHTTGIFKFVVADDEGTDLAEIDALVAKYKIPHDSVYLMPEGTSREVVEGRALSLVEACKERGYNVSTRLHVLVWGALKGV